MKEAKRKSILISYRPSGLYEDKSGGDQEVAVFNERLSQAFEALLNAAPRFLPNTLREDEFSLITGSHVRSPETGITVRNYFAAMRDADWDKYQSVCTNDVRLSCSEHRAETTNYEQTAAHTISWRQEGDRIEYSFPYASIGTQFAVINYGYKWYAADSGNVTKEGNQWMMFKFDKDRLINRILHAQPEEFEVSLRRMQQEAA